MCSEPYFSSPDSLFRRKPLPIRNSPLPCSRRWRSQRTTQLTTNHTRPTRMASKSLRGTATLLPKGWIRSS
ncbi:hypothetical protein K1719_033792 [Acacia pycnantha]|nr:hypothetical protein K1719_033792 [Acacia pycnantha]